MRNHKGFLFNFKSEKRMKVKLFRWEFFFFDVKWSKCNWISMEFIWAGTSFALDGFPFSSVPWTCKYLKNGRFMQSTCLNWIKFFCFLVEEVYLIRRGFKFLIFYVLCVKILSFSIFVKSQLNYCTVAWNPMYQIYVDQIQNIQKKKFVRYLAHKFNTGINDTYEVKCANFKLRSLQS